MPASGGKRVRKSKKDLLFQRVFMSCKSDSTNNSNNTNNKGAGQHNMHNSNIGSNNIS